MLESVRDFDRYAEIPWRGTPASLSTRRRRSIDLKKLAIVAGHERSAGPRPHCRSGERVSGLLRYSSAKFEALRDTTSERLGVDRGAVEKDYWATEALRSACSHDHGVDSVVFKGGTSLSKAFELIARYSEDVDLLVVTTVTGNALKRAFRGVADQVSIDLRVGDDREPGGRVTLTRDSRIRSANPAPLPDRRCPAGVGSRGGPAPNEVRSIGSLMSDTASAVDPTRRETSTTSPASMSRCSLPSGHWPRS